MKKDKLKITLVISLMLIEVVSIFFAYQSYLSNLKEGKVIRSNKSYAIMLEDKDHLGTYNEYLENSWPGEGYILNIEMSSCVDSTGKEMEGLLTFDNEERIATVKSKKETYCYLYFKYDPAPVEISGFSITPVKTNNGKKYTNLERNKATLDWTDDDIQYYCLTESEEKPKIACDGKWVKSNGATHIEVDYIFDNKTNEDKKVYAYTKDFGGSPSPKKEDKINYDTIAPTVTPTPNGTKNSDTNSWYKKMDMILTGDDGIGIGMQNIKYCITEGTSCPPNLTLEGESGVASFPTKSENQRICYQGTDLLGQTGASGCMGTTYQVDGNNPGITFSEKSRIPGENGWLKNIVIVATGSDDDESGIESIKTCITNEETCTPEEEENKSDKSASLADGEESKLCAEVIDKAGNSSGVICSNSYKVDKIPPICGTEKKGGIINLGLNVLVKCKDYTSGCPVESKQMRASRSGFRTESFIQTYTVKDLAGNSSSCSVGVTKRAFKRTATCRTYKYAQNSDCGYATCKDVGCCGCYRYSDWAANGNSVLGPTTVNPSYTNYYEKRSCSTMQGSSFFWNCTTYSRYCADAYSCECKGCGYASCQTPSNGCEPNGWNPWSGWSSVSSCIESTGNTSKTDCQVLYS